MFPLHLLQLFPFSGSGNEATTAKDIAKQMIPKTEGGRWVTVCVDLIDPSTTLNKNKTYTLRVLGTHL
jgi:hypothetical protein